MWGRNRLDFHMTKPLPAPPLHGKHPFIPRSVSGREEAVVKQERRLPGKREEGGEMQVIMMGVGDQESIGGG